MNCKDLEKGWSLELGHVSLSIPVQPKPGEPQGERIVCLQDWCIVKGCRAIHPWNSGTGDCLYAEGGQSHCDTGQKVFHAGGTLRYTTSLFPLSCTSFSFLMGSAVARGDHVN